MLGEFESARPPLEHLVSMIGAIEERLFTISSSYLPFQSSDKMKIEITMSVIEYLTPLKRQRVGFCSSWLSKRNVGDFVRVWIKKGAIQLNDSHRTKPSIYIGPGTGIGCFCFFLDFIFFIVKIGCSLFKSIIEERDTLKKLFPNKELGELDFYFGCRHKEMDFLYSDFWNQMKNNRIIDNFQVAFSRDQNNKIYVQHLLLQNSKRIYQLIEEKSAYIIISGNALKMPKDVRDTFKQILIENSPSIITDERAENYLRKLELTGRYLTETWN